MKLTKSDIELFIHSNNEFLECCDEELEQVVGGRNITTVTTVVNTDCDNRPKEVPAIFVALGGGLIALFGLATTAFGTYKCCKDGPFAIC